MGQSELQKQLFCDRNLRNKVTSESHEWFFSTYFASYLTSKSADFHKRLFEITEDEENKLAVIVAFRGSGKSTILTMSYPIWAILGKQQKKFVIIASQTQYQARVHLMNIKREFENNELLKNDMGPFVEQSEEWGSTSLYLPKYNARITAISAEQSVRGIRHGSHRPDLIIADDVEDMPSVRTREGRNKTFDWYTSEIIPAGDTYTKHLAVGNLLHEDSLLMRLKDRIDNDEIDGIYYECPVAVRGKSNWPGKYPDSAALNKLRRSTANKVAWEREYMLRILPDEDQVIDKGWIQHYDELPEKTEANEYINSFISVDLAISQKAAADNTAIVIIHLFGYKPEDRMYYIDTQFINSKLTHLATLDTITAMYSTIDQSAKARYKPKALVEQVQYQAAVVEQLKNRDIEAKGVNISNDKRSRLELSSPLFQMGKVLFHNDRKSAEIIQQIVGFGVEKHDDLVDAVSMGLNYIQSNVRWEVVSCGGITIGDYRNVWEVWGIRYLDE
jgi:predicted phage terminase large subunit-like protein